VIKFSCRRYSISRGPRPLFAKVLTEGSERAILWGDKEEAEMVEGADWMA
jgi:hypothetical protein